MSLYACVTEREISHVLIHLIKEITVYCLFNSIAYRSEIKSGGHLGHLILVFNMGKFISLRIKIYRFGIVYKR